MKKTIVVGTLFLSLLMFSMSFSESKAQSVSDLQAQIQALLQQVAQLQQRLAGSGTITQCPNLFRTLRQGMSGGDVRELQNFLLTLPGVFPSGEATGYYGVLTTAAVERFQIQQQIVQSGSVDTNGFGAVGPATRAAIARVCSSSVVPPPPVAPVSCTIDSIAMVSGETRTFYSTRTVPYGSSCVGVPRTCTNGIVSGDVGYSFASCAPNTIPRSCNIDGVTLEHGQSRTFYSQEEVLFGQQCAPFSTSRTCDNGTLSGSVQHRFAECSVKGARSCSVVASSTVKTTVTHGAQRHFFSVEKVAYNQTCDDYKQLRICNDGTLTGTAAYRFPVCAVTPAKKCELDHVTVNHGAKYTFYSQVTPASGKTCADYDLERTCTNGILNGANTFNKAVCAPAGQAWCLLDDVWVKHNQAKVYYSVQTAPFGRNCSQYNADRKCVNGQFSGNAAYKYATCVQGQARACVLDGLTVQSGSSAPFYSVRNASGASCETYKQIRLCTDSVLSGNANFQYRSCSS